MNISNNVVLKWIEGFYIALLNLSRLPIEMRRVAVHMQQDEKSTKEIQQLLSQ